MKLRKCISCGTYSMRAKCSKCGAETRAAHPPKYSVEDKYAEYRRKEKFADKI